MTGPSKFSQTQTRALELAATGQFRTVTDLKAALRQEGRRGLSQELQSLAFRRLLRLAITDARRQKPGVLEA